MELTNMRNISLKNHLIKKTFKRSVLFLPIMHQNIKNRRIFDNVVFLKLYC